MTERWNDFKYVVHILWLYRRQKYFLVHVYVSTWTHCDSSFTRTCDISSILPAFRCTTYLQIPSTLTISTKWIRTHVMIRRNWTDSKCCLYVTYCGKITVITEAMFHDCVIFLMFALLLQQQRNMECLAIGACVCRLT